jgi:hypothetical protein
MTLKKSNIISTLVSIKEMTILGATRLEVTGREDFGGFIFNCPKKPFERPNVIGPNLLDKGK